MSSDSDEEDFVTYGSPLDPLEEDAIPEKRALTVEDQVAKDKHGRRRFHGAFTGGFSAGFFNTVGSLEGWKPSQFKSSRSSRSTTKSQNAEDFMDEEDMDEFGIAPKMIRPTEDYNSSHEGLKRKASSVQFHSGPIPGIPVLKTLVEPKRETIGIKLLMQMGWRPGQGVGPRLSKAEKTLAKKTHKTVKTYGCALPDPISEAAEESDDDDGEDLDIDVTFAPDDYEPYLVKPKSDKFGLGYSGLDRCPVLSSHVNLFGPDGPSLVMEEKKKKISIRGQAFGVGAFEKDDDDIYANEDMSQYDFALDTPRMLAEKRLQERNSKLALPPPTPDVVEGFVLLSCPVVRKTYPPPPLPQGFTPHHHTQQSRFSASAAPSTQGYTTRLSATERAVLMNSEATPNKPLPQDKEVKIPEFQAKEVERTTGVFRPFVADPDKQTRYEKYLTLSKEGKADKLKSLQPLTMTEWEQERERAEFEQAARLYKPLSAVFSDRFVSASLPDSATDPLEPVARTASADDTLVDAAKLKMFGRLTRRVSEWQPHHILCKRFNIATPGLSSNSNSLKAKLPRPKFSVFNFLDAAPFNAPAAASEPKTSSESMDLDSQPESTLLPLPETPSIPERVNVEVAVPKDNDIEQLVESTNKMDLYKAIFLSSDESDDEDEKSTQPSTVQAAKSSASALNVLRNTSPPRGIFANLDFDSMNYKKESSRLQEKSTTNTENSSPKNPQNSSDSKDKNSTSIQERNSQAMSPPRGIFSNLEPSSTNKLDQSTNSKSATDTVLREIPEESEIYGPSLPKTPQLHHKPRDVTKEVSSESGEEWVELNESSDSDNSSRRQSKKKHCKKAHRKSKKHKEKKHKHKKKKR